MSSPVAPAPGASLSVSQLLETATQLFRATLAKCMLLGMIGVLCAEIPNLYLLAHGHSFDALTSLSARSATYWTLLLVSAPVTLYVVSAMLLQQRALIGGTVITASQALSLALHRLPHLIVTWILAQLSLVVGFSLLVVPGIFLFICYTLMLPVVMFEQPNPYLALVRCVLLIRSRWWKTLAALVIAALVILVCALVFAALLGIASVLLNAAAFQAIMTACSIAFYAAALVYLTALILTIHSVAASSSA